MGHSWASAVAKSSNEIKQIWNVSSAEWGEVLLQ